MKLSRYWLLSLVCLSTLFSGCAHYHWGTGNKSPYHTIAFAPVVNHCYAPQMQSLVSDALFQSFAHGGGMAVESQQGNAEVVLHVTLTDFKKLMGATSKLDTGTARSLVMVLCARAELVDPSGKPVSAGDFEVRQEFYADSGMERAEAEALPQLAQLMAEKIHRAVVSNW